MGTPNENIFLQVNNVKYKKNNGSLCLSNKRVGWMAENEKSYSVNITYGELRNQKISPEAKPKVQLQLVLIDQTTYTFHFANPVGREVQVEERNKIKEKLTQLIIQNKRKPPDELMEKKRILEENPHLKELYMSLVSNAILTADDFWKEIAGQYKETLGPNLEVGISGAFLADIKPQTDGSNGRVLYNLTPDIMLSIFKTYPNVKRKHEEYVPHKMNENEFWTRFFQSHYYSVHSNSRSENVFSECAKHDDKEWIRELNSIKSDPLYDLSDIYEDEPLENEEDLKFINNKAGSNQIHATMIRRFNQHSLNILKAQTVSEKEKICDEILAKNPDAVVNGEADTQLNLKKSKKVRIEEKLEYADLATKSKEKTSALVIHQKDRYLAGPLVSNANNGTSHLGNLQTNMAPWVNNWAINKYNTLDYEYASHTLRMSSEECRMGKSSVTTRTGDALPKDLQSELSKVYISAGELLRHFWACFPPRTKELKEKLHRMHSTLNRYEQTTIRNFQELAIRQYNCKSSVLEHLLELFMIANNKYESWRVRARNGH